MTDFGFYLVITNPAVGYAKCAEAAVRAGVKIIQLRMKHATRDEILAEAREMRKVTVGTGTLFIVNDDPSIAAEVEADGVHVGQGDMPPAEVRARYPGLKIVGLSHSDQFPELHQIGTDFRKDIRLVLQQVWCIAQCPRIVPDRAVGHLSLHHVLKHVATVAELRHKSGAAVRHLADLRKA